MEHTWWHLGAWTRTRPEPCKLHRGHDLKANPNIQEGQLPSTTSFLLPARYNTFFAVLLFLQKQAHDTHTHTHQSMLDSQKRESRTSTAEHAEHAETQRTHASAEASSSSSLTAQRLSWDQYFSQVATLISCRSTCHRLRVGCVIVNDRRIASTGYNGFLAGAPHESIVRNNHEQATVHAEQNAIADCARRGVSTAGATCYVTHYPCINCAKILAASGVRMVKYVSDYKNDPLVPGLLSSAGVHVEKLDLPPNAH